MKFLIMGLILIGAQIALAEQVVQPAATPAPEVVLIPRVIDQMTKIHRKGDIGRLIDQQYLLKKRFV